MARDHARMKTSLWRPESDFRTLPWEAQWAYEALCQQDALSYAGVLDYRPGRLSVLASNATPKKVDAAVTALRRHRFVLVDDVTEELLVRTYVRHDGVMDRVNMGKAVARAVQKIHSRDLLHAVANELARLMQDSPTLAGFIGFREIEPDVMARVEAMASTIPLPIASGEA